MKDSHNHFSLVDGINSFISLIHTSHIHFAITFHQSHWKYVIFIIFFKVFIFNLKIITLKNVWIKKQTAGFTVNVRVAKSQVFLMGFHPYEKKKRVVKRKCVMLTIPINADNCRIYQRFACSKGNSWLNFNYAVHIFSRFFRKCSFKKSPWFLWAWLIWRCFLRSSDEWKQPDWNHTMKYWSDSNRSHVDLSRYTVFWMFSFQHEPVL